jgi:hypothetical protein
MRNYSELKQTGERLLDSNMLETDLLSITKLSLKKSQGWVIANFSGLLCYFALTSLSWPTQTNEGPITTGNDAMIWGLLAFPILAIFVVSNSAWLTLIVWRKNWRTIPAWLLVVIIWTSTLVIEMYIRRQATPY